MFDYSDIEALEPDDIIILNGLLPLAEKAKEAEEMIKEVYVFHMGENKITVWEDECNTEYLTFEGIWQARYINQVYDIECSAETIFEYMKSDYLVKNEIIASEEHSHFTEEGQRAFVFKYFNTFLKRTKKKYDERNNKLVCSMAEEKRKGLR